VGYSLVTLVLLTLSPVLVMAAYQFLYDDELEPYRNKELYIRVAACAATYAVLWALLALIKSQGVPLDELLPWLVIAPLYFVAGTFTAQFSLDLEMGNAFFHYAFYVVVTIVLATIAGIRIWG
jgi:hypothetical protein